LGYKKVLTPLLLIEQVVYLLQHIPTTKVDAEHIPNTRLRSLKSKGQEIGRYALGLTIKKSH
jgi:hypothetical protein